MNANEAIGKIRFMLDVGGSDGFTSADKEALNMAINALSLHDEPKSNADKIRAMDDEELADVLQGQCACCAFQLTGCTEKECLDGAAEWLRKEADEDAGTD
jgi:hypothetical protein